MIYIVILAAAFTVARYARVVKREKSARVLIEIPIAALAGLVAGIWLGIAARGAMRVIAVANHSARFSWSGTFQVVFVFAVFGAGIGALYPGLFRHALERSGLLFGLILILVTWYPLTRQALQLIGNLPSTSTLIIVSGATLAAMWLPYALALQWLISRLRRRPGEAPHRYSGDLAERHHA
jgi:hypothetical protein